MHGSTRRVSFTRTFYGSRYQTTHFRDHDSLTHIGPPHSLRWHGTNRSNRCPQRASVAPPSSGTRSANCGRSHPPVRASCKPCAVKMTRPSVVPFGSPPNQTDYTPIPPPVCQNCARNGSVRDYSGVRHRCGHERNDRAGSVRLSTFSSVLVFRTGRNHGLVLCHAAHGRGVRAGRPDQGRLCHHRRRSVCVALRASREKRMRSCPVASAPGSGRLVEQSRRSRAGRPRLGA